MLNLTHEFIVITRKESHFIDLGSINPKETLHILDPLLVYFKDTFDWINSIDLNSGGQSRGLSLYGATIFNSESSRKMSTILNRWIDLFESAPDLIPIPKSYIIENPETISLSKECSDIYKKNHVQRQLEKLVELSNKVADSNDHYILLHIGI